MTDIHIRHFFQNGTFKTNVAISCEFYHPELIYLFKIQAYGQGFQFNETFTSAILLNLQYVYYVFTDVGQVVKDEA